MFSVLNGSGQPLTGAHVYMLLVLCQHPTLSYFTLVLFSRLRSPLLFFSLSFLGFCHLFSISSISHLSVCLVLSLSAMLISSLSVIIRYHHYHMCIFLPPPLYLSPFHLSLSTCFLLSLLFSFILSSISRASNFMVPPLQSLQSPSISLPNHPYISFIYFHKCSDHDAYLNPSLYSLDTLTKAPLV